MDETRAPQSIPWDIRQEGHAWSPEQWRLRRELCPEKFEMIRGMLFWTEEDRRNVLALLLENVGVDQAVRLGDPQVWRAAVASLPGASSDTSERP